MLCLITPNRQKKRLHFDAIVHIFAVIQALVGLLGMSLCDHVGK